MPCTKLLLRSMSLQKEVIFKLLLFNLAGPITVNTLGHKTLECPYSESLELQLEVSTDHCRLKPVWVAELETSAQSKLCWMCIIHLDEPGWVAAHLNSAGLCITADTFIWSVTAVQILPTRKSQKGRGCVLRTQALSPLCPLPLFENFCLPCFSVAAPWPNILF